MPDEVNLERLAKDINPSAIREYAKASGWEQVREGVTGRIYLLRHSTERLRQLAIPMDVGDDYAQAIIDAVSRIARFEKRPLEAVLTDLLTPGSDILRFSVATRDQEAGTLALEDGISLLEGAKKAVLAAACSVVSPQSHHPRMSRTESDQLLSACRLGQTERGSFVVRIACPLTAVEGTSTGQPFVRKATKLLVESANRIVSAIEGDDVSSVLQDIPGQPVISSNLCDAILQMQAAKENASLSISAQWAKTLPEQGGLPAEVKFNPDYFEAVEDIYLRLRPSAEDSESEFAATVETLNGDVGEDGRRSGEVILYAFHEDKILRTKIDLSPNDYEIADAAHMKNGFVFLKGILHRGRRVCRITNVEGFRRILS